MAATLQSSNSRNGRNLDDRNNRSRVDLRILGRNKALLSGYTKVIRYFILPVYIIQFTFFVTVGVLVAKEIESWHKETATLTLMTYTLQQLTQVKI